MQAALIQNLKKFILIDFNNMAIWLNDAGTIRRSFCHKLPQDKALRINTADKYEEECVTSIINPNTKLCDDDLEEDSSPSLVTTKNKPPEQPTNCCMSGCPNCVWLAYADELRQYYCSGLKEAKEAIEKEVSDPNLKTFLLFELQIKESSNK